jgi:hypothetical protein
MTKMVDKNNHSLFLNVLFNRLNLTRILEDLLSLLSTFIGTIAKKKDLVLGILRL